MAKPKKKAARTKRAASAAKKPASAKAQPKVSPPPKPSPDTVFFHERYHKYRKEGARLHYLLLMMMLTAANFLVFLCLVPLIIFLSSSLIIAIIAGLGLVFGMFFLYLVTDLQHLERKHHFFAALYIPFISVLNIFVLFTIGRIVQRNADYQFYKIAYASALYVTMFLLPYALQEIFYVVFPRKKE